MGNGRIVDEKETTPVRGPLPMNYASGLERERDELQARVKVLEKEIEHLKEIHELELENLKLKLEQKVRDLEADVARAFPLASRMLAGFDRIIDQEIAAARAKAKQE